MSYEYPNEGDWGPTDPDDDDYDMHREPLGWFKELVMTQTRIAQHSEEGKQRRIDTIWSLEGDGA